MVSLTMLCLITCFALLIGLSRIHKNIPVKSKPFTCSVLIASAFLNVAVFFSFINQVFLLRSGVEVNPGPFKPFPSKLSFCHWNVDLLLASDGVNISCIESVVENYNFDLFVVGESTLSGKFLTRTSALWIYFTSISRRL